MVKRLNLDQYAKLISHLLDNREKYKSLEISSIVMQIRNAIGDYVSESSVRNSLKSCGIEYKQRKQCGSRDRVGALANILLRMAMKIEKESDLKVQVLSDNDYNTLDLITKHQKI